jgi:hypothetical protein
VTYKVVDLVVEIQGVAMMRTKRNMLYTCTALRCVIECPCNICNSNIDCRLQSDVCSTQCGVHHIKVSHMFDATTDLYTLVTDDKYMSEYQKTYGYAGIPSSCAVCSQDVLQHQIYHLVYHTTCRYCKFEFRPLELLLDNNHKMSYK